MGVRINKLEQWQTNLYTLWVTQVFSMMGYSFGTPFIPFFFKELGYTDPVKLNYYIAMSTISLGITLAAAAPLWGAMGDRYGRKLMITRSMVAAAILIAALGLSQNMWQFQLLRALQGALTGVNTATMTFIAANTPDRKTSQAIGFITSSNFIGYSLGPLLGGILAEQFGYRLCFFAGGAATVIGLLPTLFLLKEDPSTYGHAAQQKHASSSGGSGIKSILTPAILSLLIMLLTIKIYTTIFQPFIPLFVEDTLGTMKGATFYTGVINGAVGFVTALAAVTLTRLGDRFEKMKLIRALILMVLPIIILTPLMNNLILFIVLYSLYAFLVGAMEPLLTALASEQTQPAVRGTLFGVLTTVSSIGWMTAPVIGATVSVIGGPRMILWVIPALLLIQLVLVGYLIRRGKRQAEAQEPSQI